MPRFATFTLWAALGLVLPAQATLASPQPKIIGFGPDLIIVLSKPPVRDKKSGLLEGAVLQGEVVSETAAAVSGWRSMRATFDVSCASHADRVRAMTVFSQHNGLGQPAVLTPPKDWIGAAQNTTYGLAVVKYFCGDRSAKSEMLLKPVEAAPADEMPSQPQESESPTSNNASTPSAAPADPASGTLRSSRSEESAAQSDAAKAPVVSTLSPRTMAPPPQTIAAGAYVVQLGSTTAEAEAQTILADLKTHNAKAFDGWRARIEPADVLGKRHYRVIVFGFPEAISAAHFCAKLRGSKGCLIRRGA